MAKHRLSNRSSEQNTRKDTSFPAGKSPQTAIATSTAAGRSARLAFSPFMRDALSITQSKRPLLTPDEVRAIYGPAKTLGAPKEVQLAMDSALEQSGFYSLIQHGMDMGVYGGMANFMGYAALQNIAQNGLIRACIETVSDDMTRNWIEVTRDGEKEDANKNGVDDVLDAINKEIDRLELQKVFHEACSLVGYYGGCLLFLDTGTSGDLLKNPLNLDPMFSMEARNKGFLKAVRCVDPINIFPGTYNAINPLASDYYRPSTWWVQGREVHATRLLRIVANEAPLIFKPSYNFLGIPQAQILWDYVLHFQQNRDAANRLLNKFSMLVFKTSMGDLITNEGGLDQLDSRMMLLARNQSNDGVFAIDHDNEDVVKIETPLGGVTDIVKQSLEQLAAMNRTPAVKLLGISPSGFNATGESDLRNYYDHVLSQQEKVMRHAIKDVLDVMQISLFGEVDDTVDFKFCPLSEEDKSAIAMTQQTKVNTLCALLDRDVISPEEARKALIDDPASGLNDLDPDEVPEPKDEQGMGGMPGMPGGDDEEHEQTPEGQVAEEDDEVSLGRKLLGMDAEPEGDVVGFFNSNGADIPIHEGQSKGEAFNSFVAEKREDENSGQKEGQTQKFSGMLTPEKDGHEKIHDAVADANQFTDKSMRNTLRRYTGSAFYFINGFLRRGIKYPDIEKEVETLDNVFSQVEKTKEPIMLYRTVSDDVFYGKYRPGEEGIDEGFGSYSTKPVYVRGSKLLKVKVPAGVKALSLWKKNERGESIGQAHEQEILTDRNLKYRTVGEEYDGNEPVRVVEIIPD